MKLKKFIVRLLLIFLIGLVFSLSVGAYSNFQYITWKLPYSNNVNLALKPYGNYDKHAGWTELLDGFQNTSTWRTYGNTLGMKEQYYCHANNKWLVDLLTDGEWNLEPWRTVLNNDFALAFTHKCNAPRASDGCVISSDGTILCPMSIPYPSEVN